MSMPKIKEKKKLKATARKKAMEASQVSGNQSTTNGS